MSTTKTPQILDSSRLVEEEMVLGYKAEHFYPVRIGEVFNERYKVVGKLGWGSASTVWLCRDLREKEEYVALKIYINSSRVLRELAIYQRINNTKSDHIGRQSIRKLLDSFEVRGPHGMHPCLIHQPLGNSLDELRVICSERVFSSDLIRQTLRPVLDGLQFLHEEARIVHTDLQPNNLLLGIHDYSLFERFEQDEVADPSPRKELPDRTIYVSGVMCLAKGAPYICDFSEARSGDSSHRSLIMPDVYRAPEVLLNLPWSYPVDVWGFAMVVSIPFEDQSSILCDKSTLTLPPELWDLFEPKRLFHPAGNDGKYCVEAHLAQMVSILGPPPLDFIAQSDGYTKAWNADGEWIGRVPVPDMSLETAEKRLTGDEKVLFLMFMRKMLCWRPEDRGTSKDVSWDEWLLADLIEAGLVA